MLPSIRSDEYDERITKGDRRRTRLVELLRDDETKRSSVNELAEVLGVSVATIRRDLASLEKDDIVSRTYGGAALAPAKAELSMAQRQISHAHQKTAIARKAVALINEGDLVILDAGSTAERIASLFNNRFEMSVVTNGIRCINELVHQDQVHVLVLGGNLRGINETICGADAELTLSRIFGRIAFVGADAVDPYRGVASRTYDQSRLKALMLRQAQEVYVIADSSKIGQTPDLPYWAPLPPHWGLITDSGADPNALADLEARGASIIVCESDYQRNTYG
ncbi:DeoR/GlpR family DNA-binding transcription regulator [Schaalia vaccimaxillae]|uniref:DeoR/GlpR family DNA-binding transcription regulator n=1 Tax=Schaalia vaccimaxillae TaxID=183916 RepID=UPI00041FAAFF|nr:DeoR/GlpR family DNA-binding transcription regulator [Schaalia vaccimaxillae]